MRCLFMREKKRSAVDVANVEQAWSDFFDASRIDDLDAYVAEGWMTAEMVAKALEVTLNVARCRLYHGAKGGKFENKTMRVLLGGRAEKLNIYRPTL